MRFANPLNYRGEKGEIMLAIWRILVYNENAKHGSIRQGGGGP